MTHSPSVSVLIIDRSQSWGSDLRERLSQLGVQRHVVSTKAAALTFADAKKIDVAVLEYAADSWTKELCSALKSRGVPCVYTASPPTRETPRDARTRADRVIALAESVFN